MHTHAKPSVWAVFTLIAALAFATPAVAQDGPSVGQLFIQAYDKKDEKQMKELIKTHADQVPGEVKAMVEYAASPEAPPDARDFIFNIAGMMSKMYADQTGDDRLLNAVRATYMNVMKAQQGPSLDPEAVEKAKKEISALGKDQWRVTIFELGEDGALVVEIDVRESNGAELTPKIDFRKSKQVGELVKARFPDVKKGKISWSSMGVGLRTLFLE
ncbi:MAG: hypothetical protein OEZ04_09910 [Nitrospinota bacterium]|nr:hypothetical protein [Nitrospinota bacterium]